MAFIIHASVVLAYGDCVAMVREGGPGCAGRWNLPGGHLELGEELAAGALRELREETGVDVPLAGLLGMYTGQGGGNHLLNVVFTANAASSMLGPPPADIGEVRWFTLAELAGLPAEQVLNPRKLGRILQDYQTRQPYTLQCIGEWLYGNQTSPGGILRDYIP